MDHLSRITAALDSVSPTEPEAEFVAATEAIDRQRNTLRLAGLDYSRYLRNPVVDDCHNYSSISFVLGHVTRLSVQGGKLVNRVRFAVENPLGELAYRLALDGHLRAQSVGFIPLETRELPGGVTEVSRSELLEISFVVVPANAEAVADPARLAAPRTAPDAWAKLLAKLADAPVAESAFARLARHLEGRHHQTLAARSWGGPSEVTLRARDRRGLTLY